MTIDKRDDKPIEEELPITQPKNNYERAKEEIENQLCTVHN